MSDKRLLLCTDLDRTLIPNGVESEHPDARKRFRAFCRCPGVTLVYVSGRHQALITEAIRNYTLPEPDYVISDVGSKIYRISEGAWQENLQWAEAIDQDWKGVSRSQIQAMLAQVNELSLQEGSKQNTHKLSYYLSLFTNKDKVLQKVNTILDENGISANLIYSVDEPRHMGLLDLLPRSANKLHAIKFLQAQLGFQLDEVLFAGDSGNDLQVLTSEVHSILVSNARSDIKHKATAISRANGHADALYIANAANLNMNGNYSAGILEGIWHFAPHFRTSISQENPDK
ncbi:MAG: HAD-IIB family hydrolase [Pseudohongiellaceae bacterium]